MRRYGDDRRLQEGGGLDGIIQTGSSGSCNRSSGPDCPTIANGRELRWNRRRLWGLRRIGGNMGLLKAIVGGTIGLAVGVVTCAPLTGMVGGAFVAQDWE